jgi:hypothetical protein
MTKYIRRKVMNFWRIFKDDNTINEKAVVGFISFAIMVIYALISVVGNLMGYDIVINTTIYSSFVTVTLGSFGIATVGQAVTDYSHSRRGRYHREPPADVEDAEESEYETRMRNKH